MSALSKPRALSLSPWGRGRHAVPGEGTSVRRFTPHPLALLATSPQRGEVPLPAMGGCA